MPYHTQANGLVESHNKILKRQCGVFIGDGSHRISSNIDFFDAISHG